MANSDEEVPPPLPQSQLPPSLPPSEAVPPLPQSPLPPPLPQSPLEVLVVRGISHVEVVSDKIVCYAAVVTPENQCITRGGKSVICDRVLRFYKLPCDMVRHQSVAEGERVVIEKQSPDASILRAGSSVYMLHAIEGKRLDVKWGDFRSMDKKSSMELNRQINDYVMALLKKPI
jgi:hypothetical protein